MKKWQYLWTLFFSFCLFPVSARASDGMDVISIIQHPLVEGMLTAVILLSILAEIKTAGFSGGSLLAAIGGCILLGANWYEGEAQVLEFVLYFGGMALILMDILLFMTGVTAAIGLVAVLAGLFFTFGGGVLALYILSAGLLISVIAGYFFLGHLSKSPLWKKITFESRLTGKEGFHASSQGNHLKSYEGCQGIALSVLRPSGKVEINGHVLDAMSEGSFIEKGETIVVQKSEGSYLVVCSVNGKQ